jgi:hypothetical protein
MGVDEHGTLFHPDGRRLGRLPLRLAGWIQRLQHRFSDACPLKPSSREYKRQKRAAVDRWLEAHGFIKRN